MQISQIAIVARFSLQIATLLHQLDDLVHRSLVEDERLDIAALIRWRGGIRRAAREQGFGPTRWHTFQRQNVPGPVGEVVKRFRDETGHGNQFGIGVSARSRLDGSVYRNLAGYDAYLQRIENDESPVGERIELDETHRQLRFVALTLGDGLPLVRGDFQDEFGCEVDDVFGPTVERLSGLGVIADQGDQIVMTPTGQLVYDLVTRAFYPNPVRRWLDDRQQLAETAANLRGKARERITE